MSRAKKLLMGVVAAVVVAALAIPAAGFAHSNQYVNYTGGYTYSTVQVRSWVPVTRCSYDYSPVGMYHDGYSYHPGQHQTKRCYTTYELRTTYKKVRNYQPVVVRPVSSSSSTARAYNHGYNDGYSDGSNDRSYGSSYNVRSTYDSSGYRNYDYGYNNYQRSYPAYSYTGYNNYSGYYTY